MFKITNTQTQQQEFCQNRDELLSLINEKSVWAEDRGEFLKLQVEHLGEESKILDSINLTLPLESIVEEAFSGFGFKKEKKSFSFLNRGKGKKSKEKVLTDQQTTEPTSEQETPSPIAPSDPSSNVPTTSSDSNEVKPSLANSATTNPVTDATTNSSDKDKVDTQTTPSEKKEDTDKDKKVEVPTIDGGTASLKPDVTVPTNNPNVSAQTAVDAGASQVGTTSQITGQVVEEVTPQAPVQTNTGASIISTKDGNVVLSDGSVVAPEEVGGTVNEDKTISVTDKDGKLKTLPNTGLKESILLTFAGFGLLAIVVSFFLKKRSK